MNSSNPTTTTTKRGSHSNAKNSPPRPSSAPAQRRDVDDLDSGEFKLNKTVKSENALPAVNSTTNNAPTGRSVFQPIDTSAPLPTFKSTPSTSAFWVPPSLYRNTSASPFKGVPEVLSFETPDMESRQLDEVEEKEAPIVSESDIPQIRNRVFEDMRQDALTKLNWAAEEKEKYYIERVFKHYLKESALYLSFIPQQSAGVTPPPIVVHYEHTIPMLLRDVTRAAHDPDTDYLSTLYNGSNAFHIQHLNNNRVPKTKIALTGNENHQTPVNLENGTVIFPICCGWKGAINGDKILDAMRVYEQANVKHYIIVLCQYNDINRSPEELVRDRSAYYKAWTDANIKKIITNNRKVKTSVLKQKLTLITMDEWIDIPKLSAQPDAFRSRFPNLPSWAVAPLYQQAQETVKHIVNRDSNAQNSMVIDTQKYLEKKAKEKSITLTEDVNPNNVNSAASSASSQSIPNQSSASASASASTSSQTAIFSFLIPVAVQIIPPEVRNDPSKIGAFMREIYEGFTGGQLTNQLSGTPPKEELKSQFVNTMIEHSKNPNQQTQTGIIRTADSANPLLVSTTSSSITPQTGPVKKSDLRTFSVLQHRSTSNPGSKSPSPVFTQADVAAMASSMPTSQPINIPAPRRTPGTSG